MVATALDRTVEHLRQWVDAPADDELLRRFSHHRDEAAFVELLRRHGAMVQGVARRALGDHHAAGRPAATFIVGSQGDTSAGGGRSGRGCTPPRFGSREADRRSRQPESQRRLIAAEARRTNIVVEESTVLDENWPGCRVAGRRWCCATCRADSRRGCAQLKWTLALKRRLEQGRRLRGSAHRG